MTTITSSRIVYDRAQHDGRRSVREEHVDDAGKKHSFDYMADADTDVQARMGARAVTLAAQLTAREAEQLAEAELTDSVSEEGL